MTIAIDIPGWGVWLICAMLAISAAVNVWHGIEVRRYLRFRQQEHS